MTFYTAQEIGEIIKEYRLEKKLSQAQVAMAIKYQFPLVCCSQATLSMLESGRQKVSLEQITAIASVLEVSVLKFVKTSSEIKNDSVASLAVLDENTTIAKQWGIIP